MAADPTPAITAINHVAGWSAIGLVVVLVVVAVMAGLGAGGRRIRVRRPARPARPIPSTDQEATTDVQD